MARTLPRLTYKLYFLVWGRLWEDISEIHQTPWGQSCCVVWTCCSLLPLVLIAVAFWVVCTSVRSSGLLFGSRGQSPSCQHKSNIHELGSSRSWALWGTVPCSWTSSAPRYPGTTKLTPRCGPCPTEGSGCPGPLQKVRSVRVHPHYWWQAAEEPSQQHPAPVRAVPASAKRGALCPGAGPSSPSHVCLTALSARRDPGFQAELSHAIVPQNSSAPCIFSKAQMGRYVWFSTVSTQPQSCPWQAPCVSPGASGRGAGPGTRAEELGDRW